MTLSDEKLHGLLVIDKPLGWSSMDAVRKARYAAGKLSGRVKQKVGHAGTLDPLATGVLVLCLGKGTRSVERLMGQTKVYQTRIDLGAFTASDDAERPREEVAVDSPPSGARIDAALCAMTGVIQQTPPVFSAIHVDGKRAYKEARAGRAVVTEPRPVRIDAIERLGYAWPMLDLRITCGRGTYIRSIARDLGRALGTGGHLASLRRTAVGDYTIDMAFPIDRLSAGLRQSDLLPIPPD